MGCPCVLALQGLLQLGFSLSSGNTCLDRMKGKCLFLYSFRSLLWEPRDEADFSMEPDNPGNPILGFESSWGNSPLVGVQSRAQASRGQTTHFSLTAMPPTFGTHRGHLYNLTEVENHNLFHVCRRRSLSHLLSSY